MNVLIVTDDNHVADISDDYNVIVVSGDEFLWRNYDSYFNNGNPEVIMISLDLVVSDGRLSDKKKKGPFGAIIALRPIIVSGIKYVGVLHTGDFDDNASAFIIAHFSRLGLCDGIFHREKIGDNQFFAIGSSRKLVKGNSKDWEQLLDTLLHKNCQNFFCKEDGWI